MIGHPDAVDTLVQSYSPAIAGIPHDYRFDPETGRSSLTYSPWNQAQR